MDHHVGDIRDRRRLADVIDEVRPEMVFHLAAQPLVLRSIADPVETFEVNTMGMVNILECIRERPEIQAAVLVTSDKAYRNEEWDRGYRETDHLGGHDPYSGSKSCAELVAHSYHHSFLRDAPTRTATTRAGNVIGGGDWASDRIVPDCIRAWSIGEAVTVRSPRATRPWQHLEASLLKLSCDKALRMLDWHAVLPFTETIELTIDWYRSWHLADDDLRQISIDQIERYTTSAGHAGVAWARP